MTTVSRGRYDTVLEGRVLMVPRSYALNLCGVFGSVRMFFVPKGEEVGADSWRKIYSGSD